MLSAVICHRCGNEFTPSINEVQFEERNGAVISVKCPKCGKLNPATHVL